MSSGFSTILILSRGLIAGLTAWAGLPALGATPVLRLVNQRELFIDGAVLDTLRGAEVRLATPVPAGVALRFDEPWEGRFSGAFVTVLHDASGFRMYYRGSDGAGGGKNEVTCYAESDDGIAWRKPKLGLVEAKGARENNVLLAYHPERYTHNFSVLRDDRPGVPAAERYKAVGGGLTTSAEARETGAVRGLYRFVSADGIHWNKLAGGPLFTGYALDTQNVIAWLPAENRYAIFLRTWTEDKPGKPAWRGVRQISRATSADFATWSEPERMTLEVNLATSSIGWLKVAARDESGDELPGFGLADAEEIAGDAIARTVKWKTGRTVADLRGKTLRLEFLLRDADLYSFGVFTR